MVIPGQPRYPFQWEAVMDNGLTFSIENGEQSDARRLPRPVRELRITGLNIQIPFVIPVPPGAKPVVQRDGAVEVTGGGVEGGSFRHLGYTFLYGWEKDGEKSVWEFGANPPIHRRITPEKTEKTVGIDVVGGKPVSEGKILTLE